MFAKFSVKKPYTVVVGVLLILILGYVSFTEMTTDLLPSMELPYVVVMTTYAGASPEEVEQIVTKPVEQAMATINNIENINSTSSENVSMVILEFSDDANMDAITIDIRESLDTISGYWDDTIGSPMILKLNPDMMPVMVAAVDADGMSMAEISAYAEQKVIPQLESVEGAASVSASGMIEEEINVVIRQDKVDKINEKLRESVEDQMTEAKEKLEDAKKDIEKGKEELEEKSSELKKGMVSGEQGLLDARMELLKKEIEMADGEAQLAEKEAELETAEKELTAKEAEVGNTETDLKNKQTEAKAALKEVNSGLETLPVRIETLKSGRDQIEAALNAAKANEELPEAQKNAMIEELNGKLEEADTAIGTMEETLAALPEQKETLESALTKISDGLKTIKEGKTELKAARTTLKEGKAALETAKSGISAGKEGLKAGKDSISDKDTELSNTKSEAEEQLSDAAAELRAGEKEINSQLENFDDTRKQALDKANVNDTITVDMISQILQAENFSMPAGYVTEDGTDYLVRVGDKIEDVEELQNMVLFDLGLDSMEPVKLSDVADVFWSDNSQETYARINGNDGIILSIQKQTNYSTAEVADRLNKRFETIMSENPDVHITTLMDQGMYIDLVVDSVLNNLIMGGILAVIILLFFLRDLKPTFIIACSIPVSVVFAIVLMYFSGVTLNIISLSGLAVGVGMLVDNSVVVIENIYRLRNKGVKAVKAAVTGAVQVTGAIAASTLTTVCVFLPIVFVKGLTRQLFTDMALTIAYSLLASLLIAVTFVPMMSATMLRNTKEKSHKWFDKFLKGYEFLIRKTLKVKPLILLFAVALLAVSIVGAAGNGTAFMSSMDSTQISVSLTMPEGSKLEDTIAMSDQAIERIQTIEDVDTVGAMLSGGSASAMGMGGSTSTDAVDMYVILKEHKKQSSREIADRINELCADLDCEITASGSSSMDISALSGNGIAIQIKGPELDILKELAADVAWKLKAVEGTAEISNGMEDPAPELRITVDKEKAMLQGLTVAQVYMNIKDEIAAASTAASLMKDGNEYAIMVSHGENAALTREDIRNYVLETTDKNGEKKEVKLGDIASVTDEESLSSINRTAQQRYITVSASIGEDYNIGLVSKDVEKALKDYDMPKGYEMVFSGENESINEAMGQVLKMLLLAVAFIYFIMVAQFQSLLSPFIVMFTIPLAFTGGFLGLWLTGNEVSVIAMIGFVMLSGIVVNNGIVLVDYINQLRRSGMDKKEAIIEAGVTRMRPILMTALTTVLGLSTMALGIGMGSEMMQPVAIVTIGGLLYATFTTLFVIPALYDIFNRREMKVISEDELEILEES